MRIIATGSSTLGATRKFRDSLAGRKAELWLTPAMSRDMKSLTCSTSCTPAYKRVASTIGVISNATINPKDRYLYGYLDAGAFGILPTMIDESFQV
jgi:hypothetical protein